MSDTDPWTQSAETYNDNVWSDIDESLLAQCDYIENENETENNNSATNKSNSSSWPMSEPSGIVEDMTNDVDVHGTAVASVDGRTADSSEDQADSGGEEDVPQIVSCTDLFEPGGITPLHLFSKGNYLCVTDLTRQLWCEQHLCYTLMGVEPPVLHGADAESFPLPVPVADRPEVKAGKSVHLARELAVHDVVPVHISSREDKWALHTLNLLTSIRGLLTGVGVVREVPIFGDPFGTGDLLFGIIDELRFDPENYRISLVELKTRKSKTLPGKAQKKEHVLQVHLYKHLWDNLVKGNFSTDFFLSTLHLSASANQPLSEELIQHIDASRTSASTLGELLSQLVSSSQALVCVDRMEIEYVLQETGSEIGRVSVEEDSDWSWRAFSHCIDFWHGRRKTQGVEIEEAWKCGSCEYSPLCEWRIQKSATLSKRNQRNLKPAT